jgi:hypothetical protein
MAIAPVYDQYASGGAWKTLANAVGLNASALNQYAANGGVAGQICTAGGVTPGTLDQYHAGGTLGHFHSLATGHTGATGLAE